MTLDDVRDLFSYNKWANDRTLASLEPLTEEQLTRDLGSSFPTLLLTAAHIAAAEWIWLCRWTGTSPREMPAWAETPRIDEIRTKFADLELERQAYLASVSGADLPRPLAFTLFNGTPDTQPLGAQFHHLVNHGTYHRGQIAGMLRQVGAKPAATDLIRWLRERRPRT
jgi:uncharacterized damage-inducible protein DinB